MEIWFTSDTHFGHSNILEYEKEARPFESVETMNETLIERWNSVVHPHDTVYHLGDFCFGKHNLSIAARLHGKKRLILGNHDLYPCSDYLQYFNKVFGVTYWKNCILSHMPIHPTLLGSRFFLNLHGHLHSKHVRRNVFHMMEIKTDKGPVQFSKFFYEENDPNYFNVSCEQNNLTPIHSDEIMKRLKEIE